MPLRCNRDLHLPVPRTSGHPHRRPRLLPLQVTQEQTLFKGPPRLHRGVHCDGLVVSEDDEPVVGVGGEADEEVGGVGGGGSGLGGPAEGGEEEEGLVWKELADTQHKPRT